MSATITHKQLNLSCRTLQESIEVYLTFLDGVRCEAMTKGEINRLCLHLRQANRQLNNIIQLSSTK